MSMDVGRKFKRKNKQLKTITKHYFYRCDVTIKLSFLGLAIVVFMELFITNYMQVIVKVIVECCASLINKGFECPVRYTLKVR